MNDFAERHNTARYSNRLKTETDPFRGMILHHLMAEEEAKQASSTSEVGCAQK